MKYAIIAILFLLPTAARAEYLPPCPANSAPNNTEKCVRTAPLTGGLMLNEPARTPMLPGHTIAPRNDETITSTWTSDHARGWCAGYEYAREHAQDNLKTWLSLWQEDADASGKLADNNKTIITKLLADLIRELRASAVTIPPPEFMGTSDFKNVESRNQRFKIQCPSGRVIP